MIDGVLLDLSGVIYTGDAALPGAVDALETLRGAGLPVRFLTNTTRTPKAKLIEKLNGFGIELSEDELFTPAAAAVNWLREHRRSAHLLIHPDLAADFEALAKGGPDGTGAGVAVVVGDAGTDFTYTNLNQAFRQLSDGAAFLALANNRNFKDRDGRLSLDAGPFVEALRFASGQDPIVLGKPAQAFFSAAAESMGCTLERTVMVGDDAEADVAGALSAGVGRALLVRTGKYQDGAEQAVEPRPTHVVDDVAKAADWILERT